MSYYHVVQRLADSAYFLAFLAERHGLHEIADRNYRTYMRAKFVIKYKPLWFNL